MKAFVPMTDDELFAPDPAIEALVPYQVGIPCLHWEAEVLDENERSLLRVRSSNDHPYSPRAHAPYRR